MKGWGWQLRLWLEVLHCCMSSFLLLLLVVVVVLVAAAARESETVFGSFELLFRWGWRPPLLGLYISPESVYMYKGGGVVGVL